MIPDKHYYAIIEAAEWLYEEEVKEVSKLPESKQPCDPGCPGWFVGEEDRGMGQTIQRCDSADVFFNDDSALTYVMVKLRKLMLERHEHEKGE